MTRAKQLQAVFGVMRDCRWRSLEDIHGRMLIGCSVFAPIQSISARVRDLRKRRYGAHIVERKPKPGTSGRVFLYRIKPGTGGAKR